MYLDHPQITATNSDTEPDRVERLNRVYGYAIALADASGDPECITKLARIHDHKGTLVVHWRAEPSMQQQDFFVAAWQSLVGDRSQNVTHEIDAA